MFFLLSFITHLYVQMLNTPALVDVVNSQRAQAEDEEDSDEHVVDGSDVADLKQFTDEKKKTQKRRNKKINNQVQRAH